MIVKKHILKTLNDLEFNFDKALSLPNPQDSVYYSKLAVLEYSGWIESALDTIARRAIKRKLKNNIFKQMHNDIVNGNYGFNYKNNFRPMMIRTVGIVRMEELEQYLVKKQQFYQFESELNSIKIYRDDAAHTWINDATKTYPAPSVTRESLLKLFPIVRSLYSEVIKF